MKLLYCIFCCLLQLTKVMCIQEILIENQKLFRLKNIILAFIGFIAFYFIEKYSFLDEFSSYFLFILYEIYVLYERRNIKIVLLGFWSIFMIGFLDEISNVIITRTLFLLRLNFNTIAIELMYNMVSLLFLIILMLLCRDKVRGRVENTSKGYFIFFFFLTIADTLVIIFLNEYVFKQVNANNKVIAYICFVFIAIGMLVQIGMFFLLAVSKNAYKQMNVMNVKFLQEQSKHYLYLEARENETKKFRHDIRSHLNCIKDLIDKGQYKTASDYMENVYGKFEKIGTYVTVHNGVVDAILNKNYSDAQKRNVNLKISGHLPQPCNIDAIDLCTIFSNLLSNAIEASSQTQERLVTLECGYTKDKILLSVRNSYNHNLNIQKGNYETTKTDKNYHGYGLLNVKKSVKKHNGYINIEPNEEFVVNISMNYEKKEE